MKTSGSKGLQLYVPLNSGDTYEETRPFARSLARAFESEMPDRVVSKMKKSLRKDKVFIDWSQNAEHKTTVCVYSMRAKSRPSVSTPLEWDEVEAALDAGDASMLSLGPPEVLERVERHGRARGRAACDNAPFLSGLEFVVVEYGHIYPV